MRTLADCFLGCELVEWLQQAGLAPDQRAAVLYGTRLLQGGILQHVEQECAFQDAPIFYSFVTSKATRGEHF